MVEFVTQLLWQYWKLLHSICKYAGEQLWPTGFLFLFLTSIFLISSWKHMLWVVVRSTEAIRSVSALLMSTNSICFHGEIKKYYQDSPHPRPPLPPFIDPELWISTCKRAKIRINRFSTSWLLFDDRSVLQNRWSKMKFWPIFNTSSYSTNWQGFYLFLQGWENAVARGTNRHYCWTNFLSESTLRVSRECNWSLLEFFY